MFPGYTPGAGQVFSFSGETWGNDTLAGVSVTVVWAKTLGNPLGKLMATSEPRTKN